MADVGQATVYVVEGRTGAVYHGRGSGRLRHESGRNSVTPLEVERDSAVNEGLVIK